MWMIFGKELYLLQADGLSEWWCSLCKVVKHCLESLFCVCQKRTFVGEELLKDQLIDYRGLGWGGDRDWRHFHQFGTWRGCIWFILSVSQHGAEEGGKECRGQHAALFHALSNGVQNSTFTLFYNILNYFQHVTVKYLQYLTNSISRNRMLYNKIWLLMLSSFTLTTLILQTDMWQKLIPFLKMFS